MGISHVACDQYAWANYFSCFWNPFSSIWSSCSIIFAKFLKISHRSHNLTLFKPKSQIDSQFLYLLSVETEVLELGTGNNMIISPTLLAKKYFYGIGLYAVDFNFCRKWSTVSVINIINFRWVNCVSSLSFTKATTEYRKIINIFKFFNSKVFLTVALLFGTLVE